MCKLPTNLVDLFRPSGDLIGQRILDLSQAWDRSCKCKSQKVTMKNNCNFDKLMET